MALVVGTLVVGVSAFTVPALADALPANVRLGESLLGPAPAQQCKAKTVRLSVFCNLTASICSSGGTYTANATAAGNLTTIVSRVGPGQPFSGADDAEADAIYRVLARMNPVGGGSDAQPCGCQILPMAFYNGGNCTIDQRFCVYYASSAAVEKGTPFYRAKAFRTATPGVVGQSPGFEAGGEGTADPTAAMSAATADYAAKAAPRYRQECPAFPIVMMPGYPSTSLVANLHDAPPPPDHPLCRRNTPHIHNGWATLWPPTATAFLSLGCYFSELELVFDNASASFYSPRKGEQSAVCCGGGFESFPSFDGVTSFFTQGGWTIGKNLFGMPYDWRYPGSNSGGLPHLAELIQNASAANGGEKVVLWAVSGGPQWALSFLHRQPQAWKDRYIKFFIAQSPLWSGIVANVPALVSGVSVPQTGGSYPAPFLKGFSRAVPSVLWLLPRAGTNATSTWTATDPLVSTPSKNYSAFDMDALFADVGIDDLAPTRRYLAAEPDLAELEAPGVDTFVVYGYGVDTVVSAVYSKDITPGVTPAAPELVLGSGDNTVPLRSSLRAEEPWAAAPNMVGKRLLYKGYEGMPHAQCWPATLDDPAPCFHDVMDALREGAI